MGRRGSGWNGALHFSHGIIAENPNLTYRMGYAAFGGWSRRSAAGLPCFPPKILLGLFLATVLWSLSFFAATGGGAPGAAAADRVADLQSFTAEWLAISTSAGSG